MSINAAPLLLCTQSAEQTELAASRLGSQWPGHGPMLNACHEFRRTSKLLASNRGFSEVTIAFVGPKNAGKSTLAGMLVESEAKRARLNAGTGAAQATAKPTWVASQPPHLLAAERERFIACHESELISLGFPYAILDVPGFNESEPARSNLAIRALDSAAVMVLVVDRRAIESREIGQYLQGAYGAQILPVVNLIRHMGDDADFTAWEEELRAQFKNVLPRIEIRDWEVGEDGAERRGEAQTALVQRLSSALSGADPAVLAAPRLINKLSIFKNQIAVIARQHLPATAAALDDLHESLSGLPAQAVNVLLGSEHQVATSVHLRLRAILFERTPDFLFPWRITLFLANLIQGATDRLPIALVGSLPSLLTTASAAAKNIRRAREFATESVSGLRTRVEAAIKEQAGPRLQAIDDALSRDFGSERALARTGINSTASLRGIETLQGRSAELFQEITGEFAPGRGWARLCGILGCLIFWAVFAWPVYGLYQDFATAAKEVVLVRQKSTLDAFPSGALPMLFTSAALALFPMSIFLLFSREILTPRGRAVECARALRARHEAEIQRMAETGQLKIEISEPRINACRVLLRPDW